MPTETRVCQNCKQDFIIDQADFDFYKKMAVPAPTWCPTCRLQRRYSWRNERTLYKAICGLCKKSVFSTYPGDGVITTLCHDCYFSDKWDAMSYGRDYDFSKPFFVQFAELMQAVPQLNLWHMNTVNSPYSNISKGAKDCYLSFSIVESEEVSYCKNVDKSRQIFDGLNLMECERCYWGMFGTQNYDVNYSIFTRSCMNSSFLFDCVNCQNCFMSANLRNREYVFYGTQLTKEQYAAELAKINTGSYTVFQKLIADFKKVYAGALHKYTNIIKSVNSTGNVLSGLKNSRDCFEVFDSEDVRYCGRALYLKDCMDTNNIAGAELLYEYVSGGDAERNLKLSVASNGAQSDCTYTGWCKSSSNLFGCVGVRDKSYCILNKQYTKEEYEALVPRIIKHMNEMPYQGKSGAVYKYGEFFPIELSPFAYNGSVAQEYSPLGKEELLSRGYNYREPEEKHPKIDVAPSELPDDSAQVGDDILQKTIGCEHTGKCVHQCTAAFRLTPSELAFYKRVKLPIPRQCPNCRHYDRLTWRNPWKLWPRVCQCAGAASENGSHQNTAKHVHGDVHCVEQFETSYAPERPETLYCEQCYQAEIV